MGELVDTDEEDSETNENDNEEEKLAEEVVKQKKWESWLTQMRVMKTNAKWKTK